MLFRCASPRYHHIPESFNPRKGVLASFFIVVCQLLTPRLLATSRSTMQSFSYSINIHPFSPFSLDSGHMPYPSLSSGLHRAVSPSLSCSRIPTKSKTDICGSYQYGRTKSYPRVLRLGTCLLCALSCSQFFLIFLSLATISLLLFEVHRQCHPYRQVV